MLMLNKTIAANVYAASGEGKTYKTYCVQENGIISLGETRWWFWNRLINCKFDLTFESWALAVWDALVSLSKGGNATAIEEGLSIEIAKKTKRESEYNWVVDRLFVIFKHVCNNKDGGASLEGDRRKSGSSVVVKDCTTQQPINLILNLPNAKKKYRFPDPTGATLDLETAIVGASITKL